MSGPTPWVYRSDHGEGRLGRVCDEAMNAIEACPETHRGDKVIILINDGRTGGIAFGNYADESDAAGDLFLYLRAILAAQGQELRLAPIVHPSPSRN